MNKYKRALLILSLLSITAGILWFFSDTSDAKALQSDGAVFSTIIDPIQEKFSLIPSATGGSDYYGFHKLTLYFHHYGKSYDKAETREIMLDVINTAIQALNQNPKIHHLLGPKFDVNTMNYAVIFFDLDQHAYADPYISHAFLMNGVIVYESRDPDDPRGIKFKSTETETLEEALTQAHVLLTPLTITRKPILEN